MEEKTTDSGRLRGIEGIRAIAAVSVLIFHVFYYAAPDGQSADLGPFTKIFESLRAGVTLFFVLSGFLLYRMFVSAALRGRPMPSVREYLRNRALRILPAYWVILVGVVVVFQHQLLTRPLQLLANLLLVQNYVPSYVVGGTEGLGIVPAWSLVVEVSFYLVLPVLGYVAVRRAAGGQHSVAAALVPVAAMFLVGIAAKVLGRAMESSEALAIWDFALPTHADWFAAGMAVAVARVLHEDGRLPFRRAWIGVAVGAAAVLAAASTKLYYDGTLNVIEQQTANAMFFGLALAFIVLSSSQSSVVRWLSLRPIYFLGLASYSLFLVHDPVVRGFRDRGFTFGGTGGFVVNLAIIGGVSVAIATAVYIYVERPALARKRSWRTGDEARLGSDAAGIATTPAATTVTLEHALAHAVTSSRYAATSGVDLDYQGDDVQRVLVREDVVLPVVAPLIENALNYGRVAVRVLARMSPEGVVVSVEDGGRGIDEEFVPFLFQANSRSERSAAEAPGAGLGLSQARDAARTRGGDIRYEPRAGRGARFVAFLPAEAAIVGPDTRVKQAERDGGPRTGRAGIRRFVALTQK